MMNPKVDFYLSKVENWQQELNLLRKILLDCDLDEEIKWGQPCYTFQNGNVVILIRLKPYCGLGFFKGVLLKDTQKILSKPGENSQSSLQIRFTKVEEIIAQEQYLSAYIKEAIEVEKAGLKVNFKKISEHAIPEELQIELDKNPLFKNAFETLTPGRQRGYLIHFSAPKQSKTRTSRIEKYKQKILDGKGFNDCTCGLSKRLPICDGSHKYIN